MSLLFSQAIVFADIKFNDQVFKAVSMRYNESAEARVREWQQVLIEHQNAKVDEQLYEINRFFNEIEFVDDIKHWGVADYWATPLEFLGTNGGDCEDFTIAKYFSLRELGIPAEKLRLMYVTATRPRQAHMVLAYYETPDSVPLVLDNLDKRILPASQRRDLIPIYSFNGNGLWLAREQGRGRQMQSKSNNALWQDVNERMRKGY
ncbi:transglutaminase-like cysteine peptidase [Glaciecola sp. XM2]|uniref:transglutaminase-like cysteine peptidase n=1 Tax=Glaciecola sp. XM2 TaxID=1914931 RepID=UPI0020328474|nr:transglutaminase-like cysteine peptidase [Glaciecola sp. XM2]